MRAGGVSGRTPRERLARSEPFEIFTRPQRSWPVRTVGLVIRLRAELLVGLVAVHLWLRLTARMPGWLAVALLVLVLVAVGLWPPSRRFVVCRCFAVETRHRLRALFVERRIMNYSGNVPILLWSRPTPVGERVWVLLRAGIDLHDIERNLTYVAVACWASDARIAPRQRGSAVVVLEVIRRDPLTGPAVVSPFGTPPNRRPRPVPIPSRGDRSA